MDAASSSLLQLQRVLEASGLQAGLEMLNQRVPHRYTVVYRFDGDAFYAVAVVDKLDEAPPELFNKVPFEDSFCQFSVGRGEFKTSDSLQDHRLDGHVHQADVQSYVGLPLTEPAGGLYGTLCHLDFVPQPLSEGEFAFLQEAALLVAQHLPAAQALIRA